MSSLFWFGCVGARSGCLAKATTRGRHHAGMGCEANEMGRPGASWRELKRLERETPSVWHLIHRRAPQLECGSRLSQAARAADQTHGAKPG